MKPLNPLAVSLILSWLLSSVICLISLSRSSSYEFNTLWDIPHFSQFDHLLDFSALCRSSCPRRSLRDPTYLFDLRIDIWNCLMKNIRRSSYQLNQFLLSQSWILLSPSLFASALNSGAFMFSILSTKYLTIFHLCIQLHRQ